MRSNALRRSRPNLFGAKSKLAPLPAPIGGWNARDALSEMEPDEAIVLDNLIPDTKGVRLRRGVQEFATGITGDAVESLMEYNVAGSNPKLFAAGPANIFDVSASGAVGAAVVTSLTNGRWQSSMFSTTGGNYLVCANGADAVRNYDGSSWSTPTINNVSSSNLIGVYSHMRRLWFVEKATLKVWYLDSLAISGDATAINLAEVSKKGGELMAMASWSRDGGEGMDDVAVFVTSKGEVHVYEGTDPDDATTWRRIGSFEAPEPIGRRCFIKLGADLCYLSSQGVLPLPQFLGTNSAGRDKLAVTDMVSGAFTEAYRDGGTLFGWQVLEYPKENLLIVNVPIAERATQHQYVMNLKTGKWCRFKGINAGCWALKGDALFCGGNDGNVRAYGPSQLFYNDDGDPISALAVQAYHDFDTPLQKSFRMARPLMTAPQGYVPLVRMLTDYDVAFPTFTPTSYELTGADWDEEDWDVAEWAAGAEAAATWQTVLGTGTVGALALAAQVTTPLSWHQTDILYERGGVL